MKLISKICLTALAIAAFTGATSAQTVTASTENAVPVAAKATENPKAPAANTERVVVIKNTCEKPIAIFAGAKENIREPKLFCYGGLSTNKVYVIPSDVVCLMTSDKKPMACTVIKPETTTVEINASGNTIMGK